MSVAYNEPNETTKAALKEAEESKTSKSSTWMLLRNM